jgi:glycosyltransferase involved in cell wall biosynthesis
MAGGGAEKVALLLGNKFIQKGIDVSIVLLQKEGVFLEEINKKIKIYNLNSIISKIGGIFGKILIFSFFLIKHKPDIVLSIAEWPNTITPMSVKFIPYKPKVVLVEQNTKSFLNSEEYNVSKLVRFLAKKSYFFAENIICVSSSVKEKLLKENFINKKLMVICNPIDIEEINKKAIEEVEYSWLENKNIPAIVAVGRLHPQKDYPTMFKALKLVLKVKKVHLIILGGGPLQEELISLCVQLGIKNFVDFIGFQKNPYKYIKKADLFLHSARYEGFANVFTEALACGQKIVTTDCDTPREILEEGKYGKIVPVGDYRSLADAILLSLSEKHNPDFLKQKAQEFSIEKISNKYLEIL